jgi:hypothetical protein
VSFLRRPVAMSRYSDLEHGIVGRRAQHHRLWTVRRLSVVSDRWSWSARKCPGRFGSYARPLARSAMTLRQPAFEAGRGAQHHRLGGEPRP